MHDDGLQRHEASRSRLVFPMRAVLPVSRCLLLPLLVAAPLSALSSAAPHGTVYLHDGAVLSPLSGVYVTAKSLQGRLLKTARTDDGGRYLFAELPPQRIVLSSSRSGYYTDRAAGRSDSQVILDCSSNCAQGSIDFEMIRGAVVSGQVLDGLREPIDRVRISARPAAGSSGDSAFRRLPRSQLSSPTTTGAAQATTDERGRFRLAGLRPGVYRLTAQASASNSPRETRTIELEVHDGELIDGLTITLGSRAVFEVSGVLSGVSIAPGDRVRVRLEEESGSRRSFSASVTGAAAFRFPAVGEGRYLASATVSKGSPARSTRTVLDPIDVRGDTAGMVLRPAATGSVMGVVELQGGTAPPQFRLRLVSNDGLGARLFSIKPEDPRFELHDLLPGSYRIEAASSLFYVKGVRQGADLASASDVAVSSGSQRLSIAVAADYSHVYGTIREPSGRRPLPHAWAAVDGADGKVLVKADQQGRFVFGKIVPGEYRICAWADIQPYEVEDEASWEAAGCAENLIQVPPDSQVEIDLRAVP